MPDISVVITVYNKAKFIKNTLQSVFDQTYHDFEIIVVNDGSTDNSVDIIKSFNEERIKLITTENQGASAARNTGINGASADYIALLDGDDLWDKDFLKYIKQAISKFPEEHIFATGLSQKYDKKIVPVAYSFKQNNLFGIHNYFDASKKYAILSSSSVVFHKSVLEKTGQFDPDITSGQDIDLWIRFGMYFNIVFINKPLAIYNHVITSLSNTAYNLEHKSKFNKYINEEKENSRLKAYIDLNRYSMAILSKFVNDQKSFEYYRSYIDPKNLSPRQVLLLRSPKWLLKLLLRLKSLKGEKLYYPEN